MDPVRVKFLLARYAAQECADEELQELESSLLDSQDARDLFWSESLFSGLLHEACRHEMGQEIVDVANESQETLACELSQSNTNVAVRSIAVRPINSLWCSIPNAVRMPVVIVLLVTAMAIGSLVSSWWSGRGASEHQVGLATAQQSNGFEGVAHFAPVAYLMDASGCNWGASSLKACAVGDSLESGSEVSLHEGVAEFRLANGVYLGVQGPASLLIASPSTVVLQYGKVTAQVVPTGQDFKVFAGGNRVSTYDSEFGVHLTESKLDIHAFSGEVSATSTLRLDTQVGTSSSAEQVSEEPQVEPSYVSANVTSGRSLLLTAYNKSPQILGWSEAQPDKFVSNLNMSGPLPLTQAYVDAVMASQPISYWRFEGADGKKIRNETPGGPKLWIKGQTSLVGSDDNRSAELRWEGNWYMLSTHSAKLPLAGSDYTLEAWIKPSHHHRACVLSLSCGDEHASSTRIELQGGENDAITPRHCGVIRYFHRAYAGEEHFGTSCFSKNRYNARRWQHVVAIKSQDTMKLFVNGRFAGKAKDEAQLPDDVRLMVGIYGDRKSRRFIGQLDEIAIYNRALKYKEIQQHFEAVNQAANTAPKRSVATGTRAGDDA